jgi:hypothetical protein
MAYPNALPPGLLSFAYHITYNRQVIAAIIDKRLDEVIAAFELSDAELSAVHAVLGTEPIDEEKLQGAVNLLVPYLVKSYNDIW